MATTTGGESEYVYEGNEEKKIQGEEDSGGNETIGKGTWKHAAFHVATTIATPAAYAPLPFALASLGWSLGKSTFLLSAEHIRFVYHSIHSLQVIILLGRISLISKLNSSQKIVSSEGLIQ